MTITLSDRCRRPWVAAIATLCAAALFIQHGVGFESVAAATPQGTTRTTGLEVLDVRPTFFVIVDAGANIGVQVGDDGVVVVDTGTTADAAVTLAALKKISPKPIRYIIDTGPDADHVGGNEALSKAGELILTGGNAGRRRDPAELVAPIVSVDTVVGHMAAFPGAAWPTETFHYPRKAIYLNGEAIEILHQAAAHTDSDAFAFFRRSDVVMAGDVLDTRQFPVIDLERGGSIRGEIEALNHLIDLAVPSTPDVSREGGTIVVPGHGHLYDHFDVVEYRDMVTIVRDRVRDLMKAGRSLDQIKAAQPAKGYAGRYGNPGGAWTTDRFIEAIYQSLAKDKP
jgi:glyoxylase-like metal-dependent hydrolase (beta-lactamase superfamily II)